MHPASLGFHQASLRLPQGSDVVPSKAGAAVLVLHNDGSNRWVCSYAKYYSASYKPYATSRRRRTPQVRVPVRPISHYPPIYAYKGEDFDSRGFKAGENVRVGLISSSSLMSVDRLDDAT